MKPVIVNNMILKIDGLNFNFGFIYDMYNTSMQLPLKIGLSLKTPFTMEIKDDYTLNWGLTPGETKSKIEYDLKMPLMIGFGASYTISEDLLVSADYELRNYSNSKMILKSIEGEEPAENVEEKVTKDDLHQLRLGMEYKIHLGKWLIPLRCGFQNHLTTLYNENEEGDNTDLVKGSRFSFGTGFKRGRYVFDLTFSNMQHDKERSAEDFEVSEKQVTTSFGVSLF